MPNNCPGQGDPMYIVAIATEVLTLQEDRLAPDWEPGQRVVYTPESNEAEEACIVKTDASHW